MGHKFILGTKVKDLVSGLEGIVTARCEYLNGCVQYCVVPAAKDEAINETGYYIDELQLEKVSKGIIDKIKKPKPRSTQEDIEQEGDECPDCKRKIDYKELNLGHDLHCPKHPGRTPIRRSGGPMSNKPGKFGR